MNPRLHDTVLTNCFKIYYEQHGSNKDKYIHSNATYKKLSKILADESLFTYTKNYITFGNTTNKTTYSNNHDEAMCEDIVLNAECKVLRKIHKQLHDSNNPHIRKLEKISRNNQDDFDWELMLDCDVDFMRLLVHYALKQNSDKLDYKQFKKLVDFNFKSNEIKDKVNGLLEYAILGMMVNANG